MLVIVSVFRAGRRMKVLEGVLIGCLLARLVVAVLERT
jgi:hypothetical protein